MLKWFKNLFTRAKVDARLATCEIEAAAVDEYAQLLKFAAMVEELPTELDALIARSLNLGRMVDAIQARRREIRARIDTLHALRDAANGGAR